MYTFETISKNISSTNNNDFFNCTSTTVNAPNPVTAVTVESTVTITQAPLPISTQATSNLNNDVTSSQPRLSRAAIGGIVAGVVGGLVVLVVLGFLVWNRKRPISSMIKPFRDFGIPLNLPFFVGKHWRSCDRLQYKYRCVKARWRRGRICASSGDATAREVENIRGTENPRTLSRWETTRSKKVAG